ncbi:hypothetical protein CMUS01_12480 [Colletotrichum musicola]|uniref:Uncharacterized protein n=1 Tax=Colletotrichum musicola TaxID=2175873 RepID=A0A8H6JL75_9PEZI|nr:hypothetical protein CMUS01_12480 [Colletotrichum musicola]
MLGDDETFAASGGNSLPPAPSTPKSITGTHKALRASRGGDAERVGSGLQEPTETSSSPTPARPAPTEVRKVPQILTTHIFTFQALDQPIEAFVALERDRREKAVGAGGLLDQIRSWNVVETQESEKPEEPEEPAKPPSVATQSQPAQPGPATTS